MPSRPPKATSSRKRHGRAAARPEAESVVTFELANLAELGTDRAGVVEKRAGHEFVDSPAILRLQQERASVAKTERPKAAEGVRAAQRRLQVERHGVALRSVARRYPRPKRNRARVMHERDELPEIDVPAIERELIEIAIRVSRERQAIPAAGTIVDGPIEGRKLHKRLDHAKRRLGIQARDLFRPENLVGRGHPRVRAAADRRIEVAEVHAGGQVAAPHGWRDTHERILQREVRSGILAAVRPDSVEILLRKVAPPGVHLQVGSVRPCVEIFALRARKPERSLGDEVALQGCTADARRLKGTPRYWYPGPPPNPAPSPMPPIRA